MSSAAKIRNKARLTRATLVAVSATALAVGLTGSADAAVLTHLNEKADTFQKKYMPLFDYDSDSCFPAAAVDASGKLNGGLDNSGAVTGGCRTNHLGNANTYSRSLCKNGWCAYVYALYFEKDQTGPGTDALGHRHDWESVVVFQKQGDERPSYLAASRHGDYSTHPINEVPMNGNRVEIVYHKDGTLTHAFRFAKSGERPEAWGDGGWDAPALLTVDLMDDPARSALWSSKWGHANFPLTANFTDNINKARNADSRAASAIPAF
ncbi:NPP1 family protein [Streptomyces sp. NBC_01451]|uniref:NPP1 family protein n=1 Tax=Streptomyces sp. NBC_01451 TaxID=2903872 RepID=UPI002E376A97|nr:NPP1 family protein [Streptomyces sp. NBC_01451]